VVCLALLAGSLTGCGFLRWGVVMFGQEQTRKVPAEYPYLADRKVCILVWAEPYTLFEYHQVQFELSEYVRVAMQDNVRGVSFIPNRQVVDFQNANPDWEKQSPARIGARFGADRVLMIELTQYTTRDPDSRHLRRGRIAANVKVFDTAYPDAEPAYPSTTIEVAYPKDSFGSYGTDDRTIRRATMQAFAAELAGRFYERQEKVK